MFSCCPMERVPPTQTNILLALAKYKFLTVSQMIRLGVATQKSNLNPHLKRLQRKARPFIKQMEFGSHPREGKLEYFYYLTPTAKRTLIDDLQMQPDEIRLPIGTSSLFSNDYFHRKSTINCEIALELAAPAQDCEVLFFDTYFDKLGSNRKGGTSRAKTKIDMKEGKYLIADAVFMLQTPIQQELYCFEVHNGKNTKKAHKQLRQYVEALQLGSASIKYDHKSPDKSRYRACRILFAFEHEGIMQATIERLQEDAAFANMRPFFLFQTLDRVVESFFDGWCDMDGGEVRLFHK